jgi:heme/copper-type cytochrome/quinol oxidase subunit 4
MGKSKKSIRYTRREEKQGKKVLIILGIAAVILALIMLVGSIWLQ